jgi:UDP-glucose 4-epimerase
VTANPRVLVTGGAGFIGTHTVRRLADEGFAILVLDDLRHACGEPLPDNIDQEPLDITTPAASAAVGRYKPDVVLHLAAQGGVSRSLRDPAGDAAINVVGTVAMLKAAVEATCRRFVFASSGGAIYGHARRIPTSETSTPRPLSPYGAAKLAAEAYLGMFARTAGLQTLALRYSNVYGPLQDGTGEAGVVAITATRLLAGQAPEVRGDGKQTRDFVFVADIADANLRAVTSEVQGVLNVGTGIASSVLAVVNELSKQARFQAAVSFVPGRSGEVRHTALDARRASARLGWRASTGLHDGLRQTFRSFQQRTPSAAVATDAPA